MMPRVRSVLIAVGFAVALVATPAWARPPLSVAAGFGGERLDYDEHVPAPLRSRERGLLPTFAIDVRTAAPSTLFARGSLRGSFGSSTYDGTTQGGTPLVGDHANLLFSPEVAVGMRRIFSPTWSVVGYGALGHVFWRRDLRDLGETGVGVGYREDYAWWFAAVGAIAESRVAEVLAVTLDGAVVPAFEASVRARLGDLDPRLADVTLRPEARVGLRLRASIAFVPTEWLAVGLAPSYELTALDRSPGVALRAADGGPVVDSTGAPVAIFEPSSRTHRYGLIAFASLTL